MKNSFLFLSFFILINIPAWLFSQNLENTREKANRYYNLGEYSMAIPLYEEYLKKSPEDFEILWKTGNSYLQTGNPDTALEKFLIANNLNSLDPSLIFSIGSVYDILDQPENSIYYFKKYLDLNPGDIRAYNRLAVLYMSIPGYEDSAIDISTRAVNIAPENPVSYYLQAISYINISQPVEAIFSAREGLKKDSTYSLLYIPLGLGYLYRGDFENASDLFEKGLAEAEDKEIFVEYAVQALLYKNTKEDQVNWDDFDRIRFTNFNSSSLENLLQKTRKETDSYHYPDLLQKFNDRPLEFGLDEFFMLYLGFTTDLNYSPHQVNYESLNNYWEEKEYNNYLEEGRKYLLRNPVDFPIYLNMASIYKYLGMMKEYYQSLFRYYGFLRAVIATGTGESANDAIPIMYSSHAYAVIREKGLEIISQEHIEEDQVHLNLFKGIDQNGVEKLVYFNVQVPFRKLIE